ncbi:sulfotransferase family 2 domain-containing protein [Ruegeria arenilitoris]|uniref:sulfotransferase family 2 domain-containing protein n=1 Tax=Ruegeria arenilitoris TaxID=1173585 RepID=UPI00147AAB9A|nr:sulfotransferase family 2 domain-containing protein [Ruegeria arenilitoris]
MPIYPKHKTIFAHIPKTGGSTVTTLLKNDWIFSYKKTLIDPRGERASTISQMKKIVEQDSDDYFSFVFVRNPWDRFVSAYHYVLQRRPEISEVACHKDFNSFVSAFSEHQDQMLGIRYFRPQWNYVCNENGENCADFIGRFEQFEEDLKFVVGKLGVKRKVIRNRKRSKRKDYRFYYDDFSYEVVRRAYSRDISNLGYSFDDGQVRNKSSSVSWLR